MQSRRDTHKSDTSFLSALFPALIGTHLYNLFNSIVQMGREFSWQGGPLDHNCFCLNFKTALLWSIPSHQKAVESSRWVLKTYFFFPLTAVVWINLRDVRIRSRKVLHGEVLQIRNLLSAIVGNYKSDDKKVFAQCYNDAAHSSIFWVCWNRFAFLQPIYMSFSGANIVSHSRKITVYHIKMWKQY